MALGGSFEPKKQFTVAVHVDDPLPGQTVSLELPPGMERVEGKELQPVEGQLVFVDNAVKSATGTIGLKARFANNPKVLWPGQFVQTTLTLRILAHAIVVPAQAVQSSQSGDFVFVVKPDATVAKRPVVVGLSRGGSSVIDKGVEAGETVVTDGQLRLGEGSKVSVPGNGSKQTAEANKERTP